MVSNKQLKLLNQLKQKKNRIDFKLFIAEGIKTVHELMEEGMTLKLLFGTKEYLKKYPQNQAIEITESELKKASSQKNPNQVIGIFEIPENSEVLHSGLSLVLDGINDPGNLGTIIRLCDWFGVDRLICSENTVDCYNPKVVQASMGSLARVSIFYTDIVELLECIDQPVYGTFLEGKDIYNTKFPKEGVLVMGNEANGISSKIEKLISQKITIPQFGKVQRTESLNVATATAIFLSEFRRNNP